jgi:AcrR family transcriptional regulator
VTNAASGAKRLTARGAATRARIVETAADLMYARGVGATTLDDVVAAAGVSKSQLYHHFEGKAMLVRAVIDLTGERVLAREQDALGSVSSIAGLKRWRDTLVQTNALRHGAYGCALGSLAADVADQDDVARLVLARLFGAWQELLADALRRIRDGGGLPADAPVEQLATGLMGALQGGYLLAQAAHDVAPMEASLAMAFDRIDVLAGQADAVGRESA